LRHLRKERSRSMLCSSDLIAFQAEHLDLLFPNRSSHNPTVRTDSPPAYQQPQRGGHSYDIPLRPPDLTRRSVSMDYPATADSPPRHREEIDLRAFELRYRTRPQPRTKTGKSLA
jgi:hypothetical protein